jgi:hypothetical protein
MRRPKGEPTKLPLSAEKRNVRSTEARRDPYLLAQKLVFCNSDLDKSTTLCKVGDLDVSPKAFLDWKHIHVRKVHGHEVHGHEVHAP